MTPKVWAIVPAAGVGQRMQHARPKQYIHIHGQAILAHTLRVICQVPQISEVVVPLHPDDPYWPQLNLAYPHLTTVTGGEQRAQSVLNAIEQLAPKANAQDWLLIHDAVRPCITAAAISDLLQQLRDEPVGGLWGVPVRDTLKAVDAQHQVINTVPRAGLWHALTPQVLRFGLLQQALRTLLALPNEITDDASALEQMGLQPRMIQGSYDNIKITWPADLAFAEHWLTEQER